MSAGIGKWRGISWHSLGIRRARLEAMVQVHTVTLSLICLSQALAAEVAVGQTPRGTGATPQQQGAPAGGATVSTQQ